MFDHSPAVVRWFGLVSGPAIAVLTYFLLPDTFMDSGGVIHQFTHAGRATAAVGTWMAIWWMTEAISIYATALIPLALFPLLQILPVKKAAAPYGHELIYLFMGGFLLALSMQRWGLHRRLALKTLSYVGTRPAGIVAGFMGITALMSMWVSNTATTIVMLPIAVSVIHWFEKNVSGPASGSTSNVVKNPSGKGKSPGDAFALCLLLGIAYGASIGGVGTLVGTPPNLFLASFMKSQLGVEVSFVQWLGVGIPVVVIFLPLTWFLLTKILFKLDNRPMGEGKQVLTHLQEELDPLSRGEWITLVVFITTALSWIFRPLLMKISVAGHYPLAGLSDPGIAMIAALSLFIIPVYPGRRIFALDWKTAVKLPWGLLILFGGGLSLAAAVKANGVGQFIGCQVAGLSGMSPWILVLIVTTIMVFLTELTSNTASTATLIPIFLAIAVGLGLEPILLIVPAAISASCAFMLPVATPPNAIIFSSGHVTIPVMCKAGIWLNFIAIILITALTYLVVLPVFGISG